MRDKGQRKRRINPAKEGHARRAHPKALDQWVNLIEDLGSYDGPKINSHLLFTTMNNKERGAKFSQSFDGQTISQPSGWKAVNGSADQNQIFVLQGTKVVNGSANLNLPNYCLISELTTTPQGLEKEGESMLSIIIPTKILERSPNTGQQAWQSPCMCTIE